MARKSRSQRRQDNSGGGNKNTKDNDIDVLSETHTIADSDTVFTIEEDFAEEFAGIEVDDSDGVASNGKIGVATTSQKHFRFLNDAINSASDLPGEKRSSKREQMLRAVFKALTQYSTPSSCQDFVESNLDDVLLPACLYGVSRGTTSSEQYAGCRCLEALSILLGGDRDAYYEVIEEPLKKAVRATGRAHLVRGAALRALCLSAFICGTDESATHNLLDLCELMCAEKYRGQEMHPTLRATSLYCWALLSTTINDADLAGEDDGGRGVAILPLLRECLDHESSIELRSAAGECATMIHEARLGLMNEADGRVCGNSTERRFRQGSWDGSSSEVLMDELKQRVSELSCESGHHMSKKAKKEQRSTFREFTSTLVDDEPPIEIVNFRGGKLTLTSWREIIQLEFIRNCLQGGFQAQLMTNPTLLYIFGADANVLGGSSALSQLEKRLLMSKTSDAAKAADIDMTRKRRSRQNAKNYFITADGDDV